MQFTTILAFAAAAAAAPTAAAPLEKRGDVTGYLARTQLTVNKAAAIGCMSEIAQRHPLTWFGATQCASANFSYKMQGYGSYDKGSDCFNAAKDKIADAIYNHDAVSVMSQHNAGFAVCNLKLWVNGDPEPNDDISAYSNAQQI